MRREPFGFASAETPEAPTDLAPAFEPVVLASDGVSIEFSRRDDPEVDILPADHLLCVNFRTMRDSVYAYAGSRAVRGTRHFGSAHLIAADHPIRAHTPDATDHVVVRLAPSRLASLAGDLYGSDAVELLTDGLPFFDPTIFRAALALRRELGHDAIDELAIDAINAGLADHLLARHSSLGGRTRERIALVPAKLRRVREFVEAHLAAPVRLDQMARVAGVSRGHFVRVFRRATGQSPHQYVVDRRVDFVRERLFEPRADLAALSVRAGFASHSHMTQAFRRRIGLTPSAFRALASR